MGALASAFLTSKEVLADMIGRSGRSIPGRMSVARSSENRSLPPKNWSVVFGEVQKAKVISYALTPKGGQVLQFVSNGLNDVYSGAVEVKPGLDEIARRVNAALAGA